jgi:hypothetical protein
MTLVSERKYKFCFLCSQHTFLSAAQPQDKSALFLTGEPSKTTPVAHKEVAIQAIWISHQSPAHLARFSCDWLNVLFIDLKDVQAKAVRENYLVDRQ